MKLKGDALCSAGGLAAVSRSGPEDEPSPSSCCLRSLSPLTGCRDRLLVTPLRAWACKPHSPLKSRDSTEKQEETWMEKEEQQFLE